MTGVTHTLCSATTVRLLCELVTAPFEPHDALICTSTAVVAMVRAVTDGFAAYLRDRHGGDPRLDVRLETIPLGVDTERYRPATPEQRAAARADLGIGDDEVAVLFVAAWRTTPRHTRSRCTGASPSPHARRAARFTC